MQEHEFVIFVDTKNNHVENLAYFKELKRFFAFYLAKLENLSPPPAPPLF